MSWFASIIIGFLAAVTGFLVTALVASLAVDWYRISSFEGGAGYFVLFTSILGGAAGGVIGMVAARVVASGPAPSFLKALGAALAVIVVVAGVVAAGARLLADISPEIDGERLWVEAEFRSPAADSGPPRGAGRSFTRLGTLAGGRLRDSEDGPLFDEAIRREDGRWIVRGLAPIFTERGRRVVEFGFGDTTLAGFVIPMPRRPGARQLAWSEWIPRARPGGPPLPDQFSVRWRVLKRSEIIRTDSVGPFDIGMASTYFYRAQGTEGFASRSAFTIRHRGQPIAGLGEVTAVSVVAGPEAALVVGDGEQCHLVRDGATGPTVTALPACSDPSSGHLLTADEATFKAAQSAAALPGWVDRTTYAVPGLYQLGNGVVDTRTFETAATTYPSDPSPVNGPPPITLSPDGKSYVWYGFQSGSEADAVLGVTDWKTDTSYAVPIDRDRMRYDDYHAIGPDWVAHHFTWVRGPNGHDRLVARDRFTPLPYRGRLQLAAAGAAQSYTLRPAGEPMRAALLELLAKEMGATPLPNDPNNDFYRFLSIGGKPVKLAVVSGDVSWVTIDMDQGPGDPELMTRIAAVIDAALATGRYDKLFRIER